MKEYILKTERLILRPWKETDLAPFAKLNGDPKVMEFFPSVMTTEESNKFVENISDSFNKDGWGFWAAALIETDECIGMIGLRDVFFKVPFTPAVEIGWRLAYEHWGKGYAAEGALAALEFGFQTLNLDEIVSFTAVQNQRSQRVMEKIGMSRSPKDDFDHPKLASGHWLSRHVLYRMDRNKWDQRQL